MDRRWLVSLLAALLADGCSGGPNWIDTDTDGTSGGDDTMVDVWWDDAADAAPGDLAGDQGPPPDGLEDGVLEDGGSDILEDLEGELADVPEDQQEDAAGDGEVEEDVVEPPPPVLPVVTQCPALPVPEDGACAVEPGSIVLVLRGVILAPAEVFVGGEVLISSGGDIACVGCDCSGEPEYAGATRITCPQGIVSPGLINAHDHLTYDGNYPGNWGQERYDHRHDWRCGIRGHQAQDYDKDDQPNHVIWAELRHVLGGATSIAGAGSAPGFLRNLDRENWLEGLDTGAAKNNTFPLGDSGCTLKSEGCDYPSIDPSWVLDNQCYLPHVAEGIDKETRNEFLCLSSTDNGGEDLTEDNSAFIHAVGLIAVDAAELAANGTSVIWSPRTNVSLYGHTAQVTMYHAAGVTIGLGTDWTLSGSMTMPRELACAAYLNDYHYGGYFTDHQLWLMATTWNSEALSMETAFGSLAPGLAGDVAVFLGDGGDDWFRDIFDADPSDVLLVLRGGIPLYGDQDLVAALTGGGAGCETLPAPDCLTGKAVCIEQETGETYLSLLSLNASNYPLAYCGVPEGEVTCVPSRPGEYSGIATAEDPDGDGVPSDLDNCPVVFNPARPVDKGKQADHDQDGLGDVCDPCPIQADTEECAPPDPLDKDADGVLNTADNCPNDYNPEQLDGDEDKKGDACDLCPEHPNVGDAPCPATIYDVKTGVMPAGSPVTLGGVVTAVASPRFWIQVPEADHDPVLGSRYSGVYAYVPASNPGGIPIPEVGDQVSFSAKVKDWNGQIQLEWIEELLIVETGVALPDPVPVSPAQVATGGEDADAYEGVLVRVENAAVTGIFPEDGEYVLEDALIVSDFIWLTTPFPAEGDVLSVTGPLMWTFDESRLEPRGPGDVTESLALTGFGPSPVYVLGGGGAGTGPLVATLSVPAPAGGVNLLFTSTNQDAFPDGVLFVPEGASSIEIPVTTSWVPSVLTPVSVSVSLWGKTLSAEATVIPPGWVPSPVAFEPAELLVALAKETEVTVILDVPSLAGETLVHLEILGDPVAAVPPSVTVPMGAQSAVFLLQGLVPGTAELFAWTDGGVAQIVTPVEVLDVPATGLILTEVLYDVSSTDDGYEWVELFNGTTASIDLSGYSLANAGTAYAGNGWTLAGTLLPGQCLVIGGPLSAEVNGNPVFGLVLNFDPDLQNSGATADAVALFAVPEDQITDTTVPVDAVIYGGANDNQLWDESGGPGGVDVGDVSGNSSLQRSPSGWAANPSPTPGDCSHVLE